MLSAPIAIAHYPLYLYLFSACRRRLKGKGSCFSLPLANSNFFLTAIRDVERGGGGASAPCKPRTPILPLSRPPPPLATMLFVIQAHRNPCGRMNSPVSLIALGFLNA